MTNASKQSILSLSGSSKIVCNAIIIAIIIGASP
jgi:hypothetical protein